MKEISRLNRDEVLELSENKTATGQSIAVLVFTALSIGIGSTIQGELLHSNISAYGIIVGSLSSVITGCFAAFVWSGTLFLVGTKLFQGKTSFWELARPMFFGSTPAFLFILVSIPIQIVYISVAIVSAGWIVLLQGFVLKQVMRFDIRRTVLTITVGFLILLVVYMILAGQL